MASFARLLAKSAHVPDKPRPGESLQGHIAQVVKAAEIIANARAGASLAAMGLPSDFEPRLRKILALAAFMHDLGKCSEHFQEMLRGKRKVQLLRHEAASLWLCWPGQPLAAWLSCAVSDELDYIIAVIAAAAHHRKFWEHAFAPEGNGVEVRLLCDHKDFQHTLRYGAQLFALETPPTLKCLSVRDSDIIPTSPRKLFPQWQKKCEDLFSNNEESRSLLALTKLLLICADVAGSALPKANAPGLVASHWLAEKLLEADIRMDLMQVIDNRLDSMPLRPFQISIGSSDAPITLVNAGCGTGKTIGAFLWAAQQHSRRRLWITYPTTGTATEGYRDYVDPSELNGKLMHGRAEIDTEIFGLRDKSEDDGFRDVARLEALNDWGRDVVTCTVDTVLGLVQNNRRGVYAWPNIANGAVVFDEIHAYDDQLFGALLRFLEALPGVPSLLMTASLPTFRLRALEELCQRIHRRPLQRIDGPADLERLPRYQWRDPITSTDDALAEIGKGHHANNKVLWVSNTVERAISAARLSQGLGDTLLYHSRFRYVDRVKKHGNVIDAFRSRVITERIIACTTQVAEMSLDLSADLLITDLAPIPAMIQRLGRLNRRSHPDAPASIKKFIVLRPNTFLPYRQEQLDEAEQWLHELQGRDLSQLDLTSAWKQPETGLASRCASAWLDGGFCTSSEPLREASVGITVIRHEDRERVLSGQSKPNEVAIPMNRPPQGTNWLAWERSRETGHFPICPENALLYDEKEGARWAK